MVYESGFTTRRTYTSRPIVTSYAVSCPVIQKFSRVYKTSYPIYSTYTIPKRLYTGSQIVTSPVRVFTSPARITTRVVHSPSPVRVIRTTTRVISSPERPLTYSYRASNFTNSSYLPIATYSSYTLPTFVCSTPTYCSPITRTYSRSLSPSIRITTSPVRSTASYLKKTLPGYGARALTNYLNTEPFATFQDETNRIRHRAQSLIRDIQTPVIRRARSCTPFPVTGYTYEPASQLALDAYVERITNPVRHVAKEVHRISHYPEPAQKYVDPDLDPYRPSRKFSAPVSMDDPVGDDNKEKQRLRQERLMTVNEEVLDEIGSEKKRACLLDETKRREQEILNESIKHDAEEDSEKGRFEAENNNILAKEEARKAEEERLAEKTRLAKEAREAEARSVEEARKAEETRKAKESRLAEEARLARKAEEDRLEEEYRLEEEARLAEELRMEEEEAQKAEKARLEEEKRLREEELSRLAEIEKQAAEEQEAELARQAAELAEIARQELHAIQPEDASSFSGLYSIDTAETIMEQPERAISEIKQEPVIELSSYIEADAEVATEEEYAEE